MCTAGETPDSLHLTLSCDYSNGAYGDSLLLILAQAPSPSSGFRLRCCSSFPKPVGHPNPNYDVCHLCIAFEMDASPLPAIGEYGVLNGENAYASRPGNFYYIECPETNFIALIALIALISSARKEPTSS